jgi:hypothetical protein
MSLGLHPHQVSTHRGAGRPTHARLHCPAVRTPARGVRVVQLSEVAHVMGMGCAPEIGRWVLVVGQMTHVKMNVDLLDPRCILTASRPHP